MRAKLTKISLIIAIAAIFPFFAACSGSNEEEQAMFSQTRERLPEETGILAEPRLSNLEPYSVATFAGGCFWCMEPPFEKLVGVAEVVSGYTGGEKADPTYEEVSRGATEHLEAVQVYYSPSVLSYEDLLEVFWRQFDPTDDGGSFVDRGYQYTSAVFVADDKERRTAEESRRRLAESGRLDGEIVTPIRDAQEFYRAEEYHQDYYKKNSEDYNSYRSGSGRDQYIEETWGKDKTVEGLATKQERYGSFDRDKQIKQLDEMQYEVVVEDGTEPAFNNRYWDNKRAGIYVDLLSGEPLFSSTDKFVSGTGWPSFTRPIEPDNIIYALDTRMGTERIETRSRFGDAHLGHVFEDGPEPLGIRYCMNSAALDFIPREEMEERGYAQFLVLFD